MSNIEYGDWVRTCQECGHIQYARAPEINKPLPDSYANAKCKKCKSESLDYGRFYYPDKNNDDE